MLLRYEVLTDGPGPSEVMVGIKAADGSLVELVLSKRHAESGLIDIGNPLMRHDDRFLVELPRESTSGKWRVWVDRSETADNPDLQAAE